jgi:hypothetical protein
MSSDGFQYNSRFEEQFDEGRAQEFIIRQIVGEVHTCDLVQVLAVRPTAGKVGFCDVQPLVQDVDTNALVIEQSPIYNVPYMQYQGGNSAVILAPAVGDIGLCLFAQNDITNVKASQAAGPPNTLRQHSSADGLYIGGVLNADPTQFVRFQPNAGGIDIVSPTGTINLQTAGNVHVQAATCIFDCNVVFNKNVSSTKTGSGVNTFAAPISAPDAIIGGVTQTTHKHGGVQPGSGDSGGPHN